MSNCSRLTPGTSASASATRRTDVLVGISALSDQTPPVHWTNALAVLAGHLIELMQSPSDASLARLCRTMSDEH